MKKIVDLLFPCYENTGTGDKMQPSKGLTKRELMATILRAATVMKYGYESSRGEEMRDWSVEEADRLLRRLKR